MRTQERVSISAFVDSDDHERLVERAWLEERRAPGRKALEVLMKRHASLCTDVWETVNRRSVAY